ncbi:right-handed parallel beta-helix repeat-containing protein [Clostridium psychrophilum]|uniref:right-handed parallel beta-helix repeat-containing protein n=1 Tax=Clostridium psychrophilum TaxID=132926 RepID=UPI001C0BE14D|nr:right-handed parallel beta-helix repeat-containing protein [Clostridium psychrophilum]MBU3179836.1 right-handed parallel beta-helix repeat-containing protein [Clostridium psychrophilum]
MVILISLSSVGPFVVTTFAADIAANVSQTSKSTNNPITIDAGNYNLDLTGKSDTSVRFQKMVDSLPSGSTINLPKGTYKFTSAVKLKNGMKLIASNNNVKIKGIGTNTLFWTGNDNTFQDIEFQNCSTAISVLYKKGLSVISCGFINNIKYSGINIYGSSDCSVKYSYFYNIHKYGVLIDKDSSSITVDNNSFDNPKVFGGYAKEQIGGHVYCMNGTKVNVTNNVIKNSGGQGIIFGYNSTTDKGTTNSVAKNNKCTGNGQEGITVYGGSKKITSGNSVIGNTCKNNRFNQIEVWQANNNVVRGNTVEESASNSGNLGAICLFSVVKTTCSENKVLSSQNNGIDITAGSYNCTVTGNNIANTNGRNNTEVAEKGNAILLDSDGISQPQFITINNNKISSSKGIIDKSGIYSTSNSDNHNEIDTNTITGYKVGFHSYAKMTCGVN